MSLFSGIVYLLFEYLQGRFIRFLEFNQSRSIFKFVIGSEWSVLRDMSHGIFLNAVCQDTSQVAKVIKYDFYIAGELIQAILFIFCAAFINWKLLIISCLLFVCSAFIFLPLYRKNAQLGLKWGEASIKLNESMINVARSFKNVKVASLERRIEDFMKPPLYNIANAYFKQGILGSFQSKVSELTGTLILCILLFAGLEVLKLNFSDLAIILVVFSRLVPKIRKIFDDLHRAIAHVPASWRLSEIKKRCAEQTRNSGRELSVNIDSIVLRDVHFAYEPKNMILTNLDVEFKKGEFWAICGESGVGKTTILDLALGIIKPSFGKVMFNGIDIDELKLSSLHHRMGYLTQSSFIFSGTLKENLLWGNEKANMARINHVIDSAQLRSLVNEKGLDFNISESGQNLSGGQRQRIAIARTLLKNCDFIIMDEPTSALDPETEEKIISSLLNLKGKVGVIMVTHRPEYLKFTDFILRFDDSEVRVIKGIAKFEGNVSDS